MITIIHDNHKNIRLVAKKAKAGTTVPYLHLTVFNGTSMVAGTMVPESTPIRDIINFMNRNSSNDVNQSQIFQDTSL